MASVVSIDVVFKEVRSDFTKAIYNLHLDNGEVITQSTRYPNTVSEADNKVAVSADVLNALVDGEINGALNNGD